MRNIPKTSIIGLWLVFAATSQVAWADDKTDPAFCEDYARSAIGAYRESVSLRCGFGDGRWSDDYVGHYGWCIGQYKPAPNYEGKMRQEQLNSCRANIAKIIDPSTQLLQKPHKLNLMPAPAPAPAPQPPVASNPSNITIDVGAILGIGNALQQGGGGKKKFSKPQYKGARLDFCADDTQGCGKEAADAFCDLKGFDEASRFIKAPGKGAGYDTIQIGTDAPNDNEPASAFKSITCVR